MRKICVITGSRAEYDLLFFLMKEVQKCDSLDLQIMVTGSHLVGEAKQTIEKMKKDGFYIASTVDMILASNNPSSVAKSLGLGIIGISSELERLRPDLVVILGDRFEALAAAQSAMFQNIPIAHLHGGEATEGLIDEAIRHSITKMSHLHFVAAREFYERVLQLGENPQHVHLTGAMGLDNVSKLKRRSIQYLEKNLGMSISPPLFLVTYHPVTLNLQPETALNNLFLALDEFNDANIVFTGSNLDASGALIDSLIQSYVSKNSKTMRYRKSLGAENYLSLMSYANVVIGNSSSGLLEAPSVGVPTVNIGLRQHGRLEAKSVITCGEDTASIVAAIKASLGADRQAIASRRQTPYGEAGAAKRVAKILESVDLENLLFKKFYSISK